MRKLIIILVSGTIFLLSCSGPILRHDQYPGPLPDKSAKLLIYEANKHIGEPFRFGGMSRKGWDCSGFVRMMFQRSLNISLPRTADDMFRSSLEIPISFARPGDLVFFKIGRKKVSHVGIYLGNEKFLHVSKSDGVIVSLLNDPYYMRRFLGLRRISSDLIASAR